MYYGADMADSYRRVATYMDRILKGAKPAEMPARRTIHGQPAEKI
jgi:hypothetical protein